MDDLASRVAARFEADRKDNAVVLVQIVPGTGVSTPGRAKKIIDKVKAKFPSISLKLDSQGFMRGQVPQGQLDALRKWLSSEHGWNLQEQGSALYPGRKAPSKHPGISR